MKRIGKIVLILFMMLVLVGTWFVHVNWNTIMAFYDSIRYSEDELKQKGERLQEELLKEANKIMPTATVRDMTDAERDAYNSNQISKEQLNQILTGVTTLEVELERNGVKPENDKPEGKEEEPVKGGKSGKEEKPINKPEDPPQKQVPASNATSTDQKIAEYIADLYICKNDFLTKLANLENSIQAEFNALPKEQKKMPQKQAIINKHVGMVGQWEKECDATVYELLGKIETTLIEANRDTDIVSKIKENYLNEKQIKKAEYMQIYTRKSKEDK